MKRATALLVIIIMIGGIFGTIGYLRLEAPVAPPNCPPPQGGTPTHGQAQLVTWNSKSYWELNITFSGTDQGVSIGSLASFRTTNFLDPNIPHLVGAACITEPNAPFQATIRVTFNNDGTSQYVSFSYGGNPPAPPVSVYTTHNNPQAGVLWSQGNNYISLLVSQS